MIISQTLPLVRVVVFDEKYTFNNNNNNNNNKNNNNNNNKRYDIRTAVLPLEYPFIIDIIYQI